MKRLAAENLARDVACAEGVAWVTPLLGSPALAAGMRAVDDLLNEAEAEAEQRGEVAA